MYAYVKWPIFHGDHWLWCGFISGTKKTFRFHWIRRGSIANGIYCRCASDFRPASAFFRIQTFSPLSYTHFHWKIEWKKTWNLLAKNALRKLNNYIKRSINHRPTGSHWSQRQIGHVNRIGSPINSIDIIVSEWTEFPADAQNNHTWFERRKLNFNVKTWRVFAENEFETE